MWVRHALAVPELPDVTVYVEAPRRARRRPAARARRASRSPFVLRTVDPPLAAPSGKRVARRPAARQAHRVRARGRPASSCFHLMIAGRLRWRAAGAHDPRARSGSPRSTSPTGTLIAHRGRARRSARRSTSSAARRALASYDPGGLEVLDATLDAVPRARCAREPHAQARAHRSARSSAASATPTPTRSCTARGCRR